MFTKLIEKLNEDEKTVAKAVGKFLSELDLILAHAGTSLTQTIDDLMKVAESE